MQSGGLKCALVGGRLIHLPEPNLKARVPFEALLKFNRVLMGDRNSLVCGFTFGYSV